MKTYDKYIGMNGYPNGAKRCWCHWIKFKTEEELNEWHKDKQEVKHQVQVKDMDGTITYFEL